jgi:hypothetical protein
MSKKFTNAQHQYATYEHETLAILEGLLKWEDKLLGWKFTIITDHHTLEFFETQRDMSYRQRRWAEYLGRFNAKIVYVKGQKNKVADALSRYYQSDHADEQHPLHEYVNANTRLDRELDHLPRERVEEHLCMHAMHSETTIAEMQEAQHDEAARMNPASSNMAEAGSSRSEQTLDLAKDSNNPTVYDSVAVPPLKVHVEGGPSLETAIREAYASDSLFKLILAKPDEHPVFTVQEGFIYVQNKVHDKVLCVP